MDPALTKARYINLVTFRRDGRAVATPVWCVMVNGKLCFYSNGNSGKIKRIRATRRVKVAPSNGLGKPIGPWSEGTGRLLDDPAAERVYAAIAAKYSWSYALIDLLARLAGRRGQRVAVELDV
jgi:hypothetical protein